MIDFFSFRKCVVVVSKTSFAVPFQILVSSEVHLLSAILPAGFNVVRSVFG